MDDKERRLHEMLERVNAFGSAYAKEFPVGTIGHEMLGIICHCSREAIRQTTEHASERRRGTAVAKVQARKALWDVLGAIRRTAHAIALDSPGFERRFRVPAGNGGPRLLLAARSLQNAARESAAAFIAHGLPPTFLDDLAARIDGFEHAMHESRQSRFARRSAKRGPNATLAAGFWAVRRLDAVVPNTLGADPKAIAAWQRARRVSRSARSPRHGVEPPKRVDAV